MEYPPKKSSNIWLLCILRKWKKLMLSSSGDDSGRSLRRALSFLQAAKASLIIPKGCFTVSVGDVEKRFVVPTRFLEHPLFRELLREAEEEFGFQHMGVLRIPCDVFMFELVLQMMEGKKMNGKKLGR